MRKILLALWPPYGLYLAKQAMAHDGEYSWERVLEELKLDRLAESELADAEKLASSVLEAEVKRKDVLESKAATFVVSPAVATAITAAIVPLQKDMGLSDISSMLVSIFYVTALIHLLVSSWYAVLARRAEPFIVLCSSNAHSLLSMKQAERIVNRLAYAKLNELALLKKSNRLSVAEDLFLRGLAFVALATILTLIAHITKL